MNTELSLAYKILVTFESVVSPYFLFITLELVYFGIVNRQSHFLTIVIAFYQITCLKNLFAVMTHFELLNHQIIIIKTLL
jgi:hypothetical protein